MNTSLILALSLIVGMSISACRHTETESQAPGDGNGSLSVNPQIHATQAAGWKALSEYVAMNVPFEPVAALKRQLEVRESVPLKSRGEAHITIITPQELTTLKTRLSLEQINGLVEKMQIQAIPIQLQCVGRGQIKQAGKKQATYYVAVKAPGLNQVREKLRQQFVAAGGDRQAFGVEAYFPHITIGFTDRDLHASDGVFKDTRNCAYRLE